MGEYNLITSGEVEIDDGINTTLMQKYIDDHNYMYEHVIRTGTHATGVPLVIARGSVAFSATTTTSPAMTGTITFADDADEGDPAFLAGTTPVVVLSVDEDTSGSNIAWTIPNLIIGKREYIQSGTLTNTGFDWEVDIESLAAVTVGGTLHWIAVGEPVPSGGTEYPIISSERCGAGKPNSYELYNDFKNSNNYIYYHTMRCGPDTSAARFCVTRGTYDFSAYGTDPNPTGSMDYSTNNEDGDPNFHAAANPIVLIGLEEDTSGSNVAWTTPTNIWVNATLVDDTYFDWSVFFDTSGATHVAGTIHWIAFSSVTVGE